jgi:Mg-chelatase subunit ChlD
MVASSVRRIAVATLLLFAASAAPGAADDPPARRNGGESPAGKRIAAATKSLSADRFVRAWRTNREETQSLALGEADRLHRDHPDLPDALWQIIQPPRDGKAKVTPLLLSAIRVYSSLPGEKHSARQLALLQSTDARIVLAAAESLAERQAPDALAPIAALRRRAEFVQRYGFRHAVLTAVARYSQPAAVDWLVETLAESDGQLKYEAARQLSRLTGQNFGGKSADWRTWWSSHRAEFAVAATAAPVARPADAAPLEMPWDEPVPKFYDVPIYARRVVFVVDRSKSMESSVDAVTRLDDAQRHLERAIRALPDGTLFGLVAYDVTSMSWRDQLVPATFDSRSESLRFVYSLFPNGKTACYDALESALSIDPNLELIVFLSDGEPTAGRIIDPVRIVEVIAARNAAARVRIDVLGIDAHGRAEAFLEQLANANFGAYRAIR